jgi:cytochrome c553
MKRRRFVLRAGLLLMAIAALGFLVAASGIIPIKASSGHWAVTKWFLHFAKRRSFATHTMGMAAPALDEPWLVLKGAGHYETGCRPCHGSPGHQQPAIARAMTPRPPLLPPRIATWEPEELFYIVKHGTKLTGMPAWVSQERDDEVRAMVAFLLALPGLDEDQYVRLVHGETRVGESAAPLQGLQGMQGIDQPPRDLLGRCARCHGIDGAGRGVAAFPKLAGQRREYLVRALQAFANGKRHSGIMQPIAEDLRLDDILALADYYSSLPAPMPFDQGSLDSWAAEAIDRGWEIASRGIPATRVPSCSDCHGPGARRRNPAYPVLAGQYADYLFLQLEIFKGQHRGGSEYAHLMNPVASRLTAEQMRDVALYYSSRRSSPDP